MTNKGTDLLSTSDIPYLTLEVVVTSEEEASRNGRGN